LKQQPSLRRDKQKVVNNENGLNATPEFKSFVAKKLSDALDRDYKFTRHENIINCELKVAKETKDENEKFSADNGIKMFSNSSKRIIWEENSGIVYNSKD